MLKEFKKVRTWQQLLVDPRIIIKEIWHETENREDGKIDYWIPLAAGYNWEGCSGIHELTKKACIDSLNQVKKDEPY